MEPKYLTERQVAEMTGIKISTLQNDRSTRRRIPYLKVGKSVRYALADVVNFMESHRVGGPAGASR